MRLGLELYVKAGIPAGKTLQLATLGCETYFGPQADLGAIERGKLADMILVAGDSVKDISQIRQTRMTMVGGVAYYPAEIFEYLTIHFSVTRRLGGFGHGYTARD